MNSSQALGQLHNDKGNEGQAGDGGQLAPGQGDDLKNIHKKRSFKDNHQNPAAPQQSKPDKAVGKELSPREGSFTAAVEAVNEARQA